jgi:hypothetical protein
LTTSVDALEAAEAAAIAAETNTVPQAQVDAAQAATDALNAQIQAVLKPIV